MMGYYELAGSLLLLSVICCTTYYVWYLTWPVVDGKITDVEEGVRPSDGVVGPRKYRFITYEYYVEGEKSVSSVQSLFLSGALGPKKLIGEPIRVAYCRPFPRASCPRRPLVDGFALMVWNVPMLTVSAIAFMAAELGA